MRTKILLTSIAFVSIIIFALIFNRCTKDDKSAKDNNINKESIVIKTEDATPATVTINCVGTCSGGNNCGTVIRPGTGLIECNCTDCKMSIKNDNPSNISMVSKADMKKIAAHLLDYFQRIHGTSDYLMSNYKQTYYDLVEVIEIEYFLTNNPTVYFSLFIVVKYPDPSNKSVPGGSTTVVDCRGACDTTTISCVEVYNTQTGEVYCKCQSDNCKMIIEKID